MFIRQLVLTTVISLITGTTLLAEDKSTGDNAELLKAVQELDTAFEKQDDSTIRKLVTPNHISIAPTYQFFNRKDQLKALPDLKITLFKSGPKKIIQLNPKTVLITYESNLEGTYAGKKLAGHVRIVESWVKRKGKWMETSYQETPIP